MQSVNARDALAAIGRVEQAEAAADAARDERDKAIVRMRDHDRLRPPEIARQLGMSTSNVRQILRLADARGGLDG